MSFRGRFKTVTFFSKYIDESSIFRTEAGSNQLQIVHSMRLSVEEISKLQTITVQFV